jgi:hypothetical protein
MLLVFTLTLFVSSALLFLVEPMFARWCSRSWAAPPRSGTHPSCSSRRRSSPASRTPPHRHAALGPARGVVHVVLLGLALLVLPLGITGRLVVPDRGQPGRLAPGPPPRGGGPAVLRPLLDAPLLQRWFAATAHRRARDPYFLYRASNLGSAVGLIAYPALVEPWLRLDAQAGAWTAGYVVLVALSAACATLLWRSSARARPEPDLIAAVPAVAGGARSDVTIRRRVRWLVLSAVPASLMLGVMSYVTMDTSPMSQRLYASCPGAGVRVGSAFA